LAVAAAGALVSFAALARDVEPFPEIRPATRGQAIEYLVDSGGAALPCLTSTVLTVRHGTLGAAPADRRAVALLGRRAPFADERVLQTADGTLIRYTVEPNAFDRVSPVDDDGDGTPDVLQATLDGLEQGRELFVGRLGLPTPRNLEVLLARLGEGVDGYLIPSSRSLIGDRMLLEASPAGGAAAARRAAIHQFAHAIAEAAGPRFPQDWAEALATWSTLTLDGVADDWTRALLSARLERLGEGLITGDARLQAANALWFAFLEEAYGMTAVRIAVEELASGLPSTTALDRALRRVSSDDLAAALREFHLWCLLVGRRSDDQHFSFARQLEPPRFASTAEGLPALSVQADPALAPVGATQVQLRPDTADGGMRVHFDGEFNARWELDLVLLRADGAKHRLPVALADGRAEVTIPLHGIEEAWLLVRNLGGDGDGPRRYTYSAHHEPEFPFALVSLDATRSDPGAAGVLVSWETAAEFDLFGFNVLRQREGGSAPVTVNPVWIPALGDASTATSYRFLDAGAEPGVGYLYTIEGITKDGLTSRSASAAVHGSRTR